MKTTFNEAWGEAVSTCIDDGMHLDSRVGGCKEVIGYSFKLSTISHNFLLNPRRAVDPRYASAEVLWHLSGSCTLEMIQHYAPHYDRFAESDGLVYGSYGGRMESGYSGNQLRRVISLLRSKPNTRQAVIQMWRDKDLWYADVAPRNDVPCTLSWQFILRENVLHMITYTRSNDVWLGLPYDVYLFTTIQQLVAEELGATAGTYTHNVGSLHIYDKHREKAEEALRVHAEQALFIHGYQFEEGLNLLEEALLLEETNRLGGVPNLDWYQPGSILMDAANTCAGCDPESPMLKEALYLFEERKNRNVDS